jgi:aspartyl-tRNA(Asn)/glutamyl-tRNA(Gln) amidotransferase subunit A
MDLKSLTAEKIKGLIERGEASAVEICRAFQDRIGKQNPGVRAFLHYDNDFALNQAERIDRMKRAGEPLPQLAGLPMAIKDNLLIRGLRCTCGSRNLENFVAPYNATVIDRLTDAGAVFLGKANLDEYAMGSSTENSAFHPTRNPHRPDHVPGGSSGGSAASVAADMAVAALGTDTGGSIRQPASFCGVVGMKPTYSRVSRYGLVAFGSSLDQIGPLAHGVEDVARILKVISGKDPRDATSLAVDVPDYVAGLGQSIEGLKIGMPKEYRKSGISESVRTRIEAGLKLLQDLGCRLVEVDLPHTDYAIATYYVIAMAEASSNLARFDGVRYGLRIPGQGDLSSMYRETRDAGFGAEVKRRIMLGTFVLSSGYYDAYYLKAQQVRTLIKRDFETAFQKVDLLISPTSPTPPFRLGEKTNDPLAMYLSDIFTITANLVGIPGISLPCGQTPDGMPVGIQLLGRHFDEQLVLNTAHAFEQAGGFAL